MDQGLLTTIFEVFQEILATLNLQDNIIGYICCLTLLCLILVTKIFTICLVLRKVKNCNRVSDLQELEMMMIWNKMQGLEYMLVAAAIFFVVSFLWLLNTLGFYDCCKSNSVKSALHCITLVITHSDQVLKNLQSATKTRHSRESHKLQTPASTSTNQLIPYNIV